MQVKRKLQEYVSKSWMTLSLVFILLVPFLIGTGLYLKSVPILEENSLFELIFSSEWAPSDGKFGFWSFIYGSFYATGISLLISIPICFLAGIYTTQFASKTFKKIIQPVIDILAGLPSVVYGVWGVLMIVPFIAEYVAPFFGLTTTGYCVLSGGIVLAIMCIPYMLNMIIEVLNTVPVNLKETSLSMGSTYWESIKKAVLKKCYPGIIASFGLGITKAFGETMAVLMVVGNVIQISGNPFDAAYPLPALIANNYGEMMSIPMYDSAMMFSALILLAIILGMNLFFRYIINKVTLK